jgi:hypothetical protein
MIDASTQYGRPRPQEVLNASSLPPGHHRNARQRIVQSSEQNLQTFREKERPSFVLNDGVR